MKKLSLILLVCSLLACQVFTPAPTPGPTATVSISTPVAPVNTTPTESPAASAPATSAPATSSAEALPPFTLDLSQPFATSTFSFEPLAPGSWTPQPYAGPALVLPLNLDQLSNGPVLTGLTSQERAALAQNGFIALHTQEAQFGDIRVETASKTGQPYYLTTDAAFHSLHLLFDDTLKALELQSLRPKIEDLTQATLDEVKAESAAAQGTSLENETQQAIAYLSVALKLLDSGAQIDPAMADKVSQQVDQIMAGGGKAKSVLFPDFEDDYGAYKPVGHYAGDPDLESYFRAMTWFGRVHFRLADPENPNFVPSRVPLIITLALRRAQVDGAPASEAWGDIQQLLNFLIGPSDDAGPLEYAALMDSVYGNTIQIQDLADDAHWQNFLQHSDQLPAPQINSLFVKSTVDLTPEKGWRFMGQRFTLDAYIFQNLIFDKVQARADGTRRELPTGLDVMAAFGSQAAQATLQGRGDPTFPNYTDNLNQLQGAVQNQPEAQWLSRFYDTWLYAFQPVVAAKQTAYPLYMQTAAWGYKDLNTALGSWAELKHDTVLYSKAPEGAGGGGPPLSDPAPSYVEPNPEAFYRMAYMAQSLAGGLQAHTSLDVPLGDDATQLPVSQYVQGISDLGDRLKLLGDIAAKELAGQPITAEENNAITLCLGLIECINENTGYNIPSSEMPKAPVIAAVAGAGDNILEVGVGGIDRIYVVVPLEGQLEVAQGGIFSYYEFAQPRDQRLTDDEWRTKLTDPQAPALPAWASNFVGSGGHPAEWLAFRKNDVYIVNEAGNNLNVRTAPTTSASIVTQLTTGAYVQILDGPVTADGHTWWKVQSLDYNTEPTGWAVENHDWYERSYLP